MKNSVLLIGLVALSACANPIVGDWESKEKIGGQNNKMTLAADGDKITGDADVYFGITIDGTNFGVHGTFSAEGKDKGDGKYELTMTCKSACNMANASDCITSSVSGFDIEMDCELSSDETEMDCDAGGNWSNYTFEWEKQEE